MACALLWSSAAQGAFLRPHAPSLKQRVRSSSSASSSALSAASPLLDAFAQRAATGAWAGWQCDFDGATGALRRVPDRYVPEALVEWGQVPDGFELLAAEVGRDDVSFQGLSPLTTRKSPSLLAAEALVEHGAAAPRLERRFARMLPEEGCANDNLAAEYSSSTLELLLGDASASDLGVAGDDGDDDVPRVALAGCDELGAFTLDGPASAGGDVWHLRTIFAASAGDGGARRRVRVTLRFDAAAAAVRGAVRVAAERRVPGDALRALHSGADDGFGRSWPERGTRRTGIDARSLMTAIDARCFTSGGANTGVDEEAGLALPMGVRVRVLDRAVEVALAQEDGGALCQRVVRREFDAAAARLVPTFELRRN